MKYASSECNRNRSFNVWDAAIERGFREQSNTRSPHFHFHSLKMRGFSFSICAFLALSGTVFARDRVGRGRDLSVADNDLNSLSRDAPDFTSISNPSANNAEPVDWRQASKSSGAILERYHPYIAKAAHYIHPSTRHTDFNADTSEWAQMFSAERARKANRVLQIAAQDRRVLKKTTTTQNAVAQRILARLPEELQRKIAEFRILAEKIADAMDVVNKIQDDTDGSFVTPIEQEVSASVQELDRVVQSVNAQVNGHIGTSRRH